MTTTSTAISTVQEVVKRLRAEMPLTVTLPDVTSLGEFTVKRENILALLVVDVRDLVSDAQSVAMLYAECARAQRASERAAAAAEREFTSWKSQIAGEARRKGGEKKLTVAEAEDAYRTHGEYTSKAGAVAYYEALAGLFEDLKQAFAIKARMIETLLRASGAADRAFRVEGQFTGSHG